MVTFSRIVLPRADDHAAGLFGHVDVLRQSAQHGPLEDVVALAPAWSPLLTTTWFSSTQPVADVHVRLDDSERADPHVRPRYVGFRTDQGQAGGFSW